MKEGEPPRETTCKFYLMNDKRFVQSKTVAPVIAIQLIEKGSF